MDRLRQYFSPGIRLIAQGEIVAESLVKYLGNHPEIDSRCSKQATISFFTTDDCADFDRQGGYFYGPGVKS
jgi:glutamate racemase